MTTMTEKFKILGQYIKDMSSETKNVETYIFVNDKILFKAEIGETNGQVAVSLKNRL